MNNTTLQCPHCSSAFQVSADAAGQVVACPVCQSSVAIPNDLGQAPPSFPEETAAPQVVVCPNCEGQFGVPQHLEQQRIACPHCQTEFSKQRSGGKSTVARSVAPDSQPPDPTDMFAPGYAPPAEAEAQVDRVQESGDVESPTSVDNQPSPAPDRAPPPVGQAPAHVSTDAEPIHEAALADTNVEQLLPPRFLVGDATEPNVVPNRANTKIVLPDGAGGTTQFDSRIVTVQYRGQAVELVSRSPDEQQRYRRRVNIISLLIGLILIALAFALLVW